MAGLLEVFKGILVAPEIEVDRRQSFEASLDRHFKLANCCAAGAARFGMNSEIHSTSDYARTQRWAAALLDEGFDGMRYFVRSDPSRTLIGYALFGPKGRGDVAAWPAGTSAPVSLETRAEAERWGLRIVPTP